ncbi:MAG: flagella basal body P-ring formation protein FlgA [Acidobacteriota bacterium]
MKLLLAAAMVAVYASACTPVEGDRIRGSEMAAENAAFAAADPALDLGPAPLAGTRRTFRYFELERVARENGIELASGAAREACFERATQVLTAAVLEDVLRAALVSQAGSEHARIEVVDYSHNPLPVGTLEFPVAGLAATGLWRGRVLYGENRSTPVWVRVKVTDEVTGKPIVATRVPSATPEVNRGSTVRVEVSSGGVLLGFDATAEGSGRRGEAIVVRNIENGQKFRAVVEGPGKVAVRK